jgi:hypothetical protein
MRGKLRSCAIVGGSTVCGVVAWKNSQKKASLARSSGGGR